MMKYPYKKIILLLTIFQCYLCYAPSVRSKSRADKLSDPKILKSLNIQSIDTMSESPSLPKQTPPETLQKTEKIPLEQSVQEPLEKTSPEKMPTLLDAFQGKIEQSTFLTKGIIDYFFQLTEEVLHNDDKKSAQQNNQKVRVLFDGLRYPIYRHLRDVISACADRNSFFNGLIETTLINSTESPGLKEAFIKNLQGLAKALKEFKIYHIDKPLNTDIENHIKKIEPLLTMIKKFKSIDETQQSLEQIAEHESVIITKDYINVLKYMQEYLQEPLIATNLPAREGLGKYGLRTGYKGAKALGRFAVGKMISAAATVGMTKLSNYLKGIKEQTPFDAIKQQIQKTSESPFLNIPAPKTLIPEPSLVQKTSEFLKSPSGMVTGGAGAITLGSTLLSTGVLGKRVASISQKIAVGSGAIALGSGVIASGLGQTIFNTVKYGLNSFVWPFTVDNYILPLIHQSVIMRTILYLTQIPKTSLDKKMFYELLDGLNTANFNLMTDSTNFVCAYMQELAQKIKSNPALAMDEISAALQSVQIELFRHRRFIISELSKDKAFTGNYLAYLHAQYLANHNSYFSEQEIVDAHKTIGASAKKITLQKSSEGKVFTVASQEGMDIIAQLQKRNSDDELNREDLIRLRGPISNNELKKLIMDFEETRRKIVPELKSFGTQSRYQLVQNYWNSVIDQEYSKKIKSHLADLKKDMRSLMYDAQEQLPVGEIIDEEFTPYKYADAQPIEIPSPFTSPFAAQLFNDILVQQYIEPLEYIAKMLDEGSLHNRLPADKNWYLKYPLLATKAATRGGLYVAKTIADEGVIPVAIAYFTGGISGALLKIKERLAFSGIASTILGIDISSIGSIASSGVSQIGSIGGGQAGFLRAVFSPERFVSNIKHFYQDSIRRPFVHITQR